MATPKVFLPVSSWSCIVLRWLVPAMVTLSSSMVHADSRELDASLTFEQHYSLASEALSIGDVGEAVERLRISAGMGHMRSMEVLGLILLHGPTMIGSRASSNFCEAQRWLRGARAAGSHLAVTYTSLMARSRIAGPIADCRN